MSSPDDRYSLVYCNHVHAVRYIPPPLLYSTAWEPATSPAYTQGRESLRRCARQEVGVLGTAPMSVTSYLGRDCSSSSLDLQAIDLFSLSWYISLQLFSHPPLSCLDSLLPYFDDYHANILIPWPFAYWLHLPVKPPTLDKPHDVSPLNLNSNGTTVNSCSHIPLGSPQCSAILPRFPTQFASLFPTRAVLNFLHCP